MLSPFAHRLLVVTGKGGVGKTTLSGALGLLAARQGVKTLIVDMNGSGEQLSEIFGAPGEREPGVAHELMKGLWRTSIDEEGALREWLQTLGGRLPGRLLASRESFQYFAAAAPGARELMSMAKVSRLVEDKRYKLVILDAPATGHALGLLSSPRTVIGIARTGPIASQAKQVRALLEDPKRTAYFAVTQCGEMSILETFELQSGIAKELGLELEAVIVNGLVPQHFNGAELEQIMRLEDNRTAVKAAVGAAHFAHTRASSQRTQLTRLRKNGLVVVTVPYVFTPQFDLAALAKLADRLERGLGVDSATAARSPK